MNFTFTVSALLKIFVRSRRDREKKCRIGIRQPRILAPAQLGFKLTGGKFATGINDTSGTGGIFIAGFVDAGGKFATGVVDTAGVVDTSGRFATYVAEMTLMLFSGAWEKTIHEKNLKQKIS